MSENENIIIRENGFREIPVVKIQLTGEEIVFEIKEETEIRD